MNYSNLNLPLILPPTLQTPTAAANSTQSANDRSAVSASHFSISTKTPLPHSPQSFNHEMRTTASTHRLNVLNSADAYQHLEQAAETGDHSAVKHLLHNRHVDVRNHFQVTVALINAALNGHIEIIKLLHEAGADLCSGDEEEYTPLMAAAEKGHTEIVKWLLPLTGWEAVDHGDRNALHCAAQAKGDPETVQALLDAGADPNSTCSSCRTPLMELAQRGHLKSALLLLQYGADPSIQSFEKKTAKQLTQTAYERTPEPNLQKVIELFDAWESEISRITDHIDEHHKGNKEPFIFSDYLHNKPLLTEKAIAIIPELTSSSAYQKFQLYKLATLFSQADISHQRHSQPATAGQLVGHHGVIQHMFPYT